MRLTTALGTDTLLVEPVDGREGLNEGYRFAITALCTDAHIPIDSLLGQPALPQILTSHGRTDLRPLQGHITVP